MLELPRQPLADLPGSSFDLTPVAGLDLDPLGETSFKSSQRGSVGMTCRRAHEFFEQDHCVVQAHLGEVGGAIEHQAR
jgi:hypothetical protein